MREGTKGRRRGAACFRAVFTAVGSVVGAGFISGRELIVFFGEYSLRTVLFAAVLFAVCFFLFYSLGGACGGFSGVLRLFGKAAPLFKAGILAGGFVTSFSMLAAVRALFPEGGYFLSAALLAACILVVERGVKGVRTANALLTPAVLLTVAVLLLRRGNFAPSAPVKGVPSFWSVTLYVFMNVFLCTPALCDLGYAERREGGAEIRSGVPFAICAACLIGFSIGLILSAVSSEKSSYTADFPLAYVLSEGRVLFFALSLGGIATTLFTAYYPLDRIAERKGEWGRVLLALLTFVCALLPFGTIIGRLYPVLGIFGLVLCVATLAVTLVAHTHRRNRTRCHTRSHTRP